jgi:hypothetical protein
VRPDPAYGSGGASTVGTYDTPSSGERSKTDEAREQGRQVADTAKGEARGVAEEAKGQAGRVAEEAKEQGRNLLSEAQSQLRQQASSQTDRAAGFVQEIAGSLRALSEGRTEEAGPLGDYARQATQQVQQFADRIEQRGFDGLVQDVQRFARRRPGGFLLGAAVAGFATGRLVRGARDAQSSSDDQYSGQLTSTSSTGTYGTSGTYTTSEAYTGTAPQVGGSAYPGLASRDEPLTDAADESAYAGSRSRPDERY